MHHKRKRPKSRRSGCLLCKPHKHQGWSKDKRLLPRDHRQAERYPGCGRCTVVDCEGWCGVGGYFPVLTEEE